MAAYAERLEQLQGMAPETLCVVTGDCLDRGACEDGRICAEFRCSPCTGDDTCLADELCLAWLLDRRLYELGWETEWEGEITGVIGSGLFVRFGEVFEGYVPARRLPGDYFELNTLGTALVGRRGGKTYRLGDPVSVRVEKIERYEGKVELSPA